MAKKQGQPPYVRLNMIRQMAYDAASQIYLYNSEQSVRMSLQTGQAVIVRPPNDEQKALLVKLLETALTDWKAPHEVSTTNPKL